MHTSRSLAAIEVFDTVGRPVLLGSLWRTQTVVLAFVRHFG